MNSSRLLGAVALAAGTSLLLSDLWFRQNIINEADWSAGDAP